MLSKKVFVSGCYDMLHSGHIAFFKAASEYGDLYVDLDPQRHQKDMDLKMAGAGGYLALQV